MRRKYDIRNKKSFIIILILSIAIISVFSLFIYKYSKTSKIEYVIESGSVLQDANKNYISIDDDAILKIRWNDSYYLLYEDEKINLGKKVIVYNTITGSMKLYGTFYEISEDGKIVENKNETILANTTNSKFYKLDDRKYLIIDRVIYSDDKSIEAKNYLLVELDKAGNAKLSNNKINLKTITPTKLVTSKYTFDIANELLNFGKYDIDLKKIIGSTNQYKPEKESSDDSSIDGSGNGTGNGGGNGNDSGDGSIGSNNGNNSIGSGIGTGTGGSGDIINNGDIGSIPSLDEIMEKIKMTSIIRIVEGITKIDIDYVIYDPYNEYKDVYVEVVKAGQIDVIHMSKIDTHITIDNLVPNTEYKLNFVYTTVKKNAETGTEELIPNTYESFELKTRMPEYMVSVYKVSKVNNTLTYKVDLQKDYSVSLVNVNLSFDYFEFNTENMQLVKKNASIDSNVSIKNGDKSVYGTFDISNYDISSDTLIRLTVKSVVSGEFELPVNSSYTFRFGR